MRRPLRSIFSAVAAAASCATALAVPPDRGDLAIAYMRFERAVAERAPTGERLAAVNRGFDSLTGAFFAGDYATALNALASMTAGLELPADASEDARAASREAWRGAVAQRISGVPKAIVAGADFRFELAIEPLDGVFGGVAPRAIALRDAAGAEVARAPWRTDGPLVLAGKAPAAGARLHAIVERADGVAVEFGRSAVLAAPLAESRAALAARLEALRGKPEVAAEDIEAISARLALLSDQVDRTRSAALLADPGELVAAIGRELDRLERGERPFAGLRGTHWRPRKLLGAQIPVACHVPPGEGPFPVVVAFHGAGGDECMFFEGYGMGALRRLADELGFVAVCPVTVPFAASPNLIDALIESVGKDASIDASRVVLVGHSLGAVTASRLAALKPERVRAAALIAGFADIMRSKPPAPRRLWAAELDPLFALPRLEAERNKLVEAGRSLELTVVKDQGHTLVVGAVLPEAVRWALAQAPPATQPTIRPE